MVLSAWVAIYKKTKNMKDNKNYKALNLLERIDNNFRFVDSSKRLSESKSGIKKVCYDPERFIDFLESLPDATIINIAIVQADDLDLPKIKRKNPATNRMKAFRDYSVLNMSGQESVAAVAKVSRYNIMYRKQNKLNKEYWDHKAKLSDLNARYGLKPVGDGKGFKGKTGYGSETRTYTGKDDDKKGTLYLGINTARVMGPKPYSRYYLLDANGNIIGKDKLDKNGNPTGGKEPLGDDVLGEYPPMPKENSYVSALRRLGNDETIVNRYLEELEALGPMNYRYPSFDHILWCCATPKGGGESCIFVNKRLSRNIDGVDINPSSFESIVKGIYSYSESELNNALQQSGAPVKEGRVRNAMFDRLAENKIRNLIFDAVKSALLK